MVLTPDLHVVGNVGKFTCRPGFFRYSELNYATTAAGYVHPKLGELPSNYINCTGTAHTDLDPSKYISKWKKPYLNVVEECKPVTCAILSGTMKHVERQPQIPAGSNSARFPYNYQFKVNCSLGYVNYKDTTNTVSGMSCGQDPSDMAKGRWEPPDYDACIGVRCNATEMFLFAPTDGKVHRAVNKVTGREYGAYERNQFNVYNQIVSVQCKLGYFFPDRSFEKHVICDLKEGSRIEGVWKGFQGTQLPVFSQCKPVTCKYQDIRVSKNGQRIESLKFKTTFRLHYHGHIETLSTHNGSDYPYNTMIQYFCENGHDTTAHFDNLNVTCGKEGNWQPRMTGCLKISENSSDLAGNGKHYVPPPQDAPNSQSIGAMAIVILVVFLCLILILDLTTFSRDFKLMHSNLRNLRLKMKQKANEHERQD